MRGKFYKKIPLKKKLYFSDILKKNPKSYNLLNELVELGAFVGNSTRLTHFSQIPFILAYRNNYSFYNIEKCIILFIKAIKFIKIALTKKTTELVVAGSPLGKTEEASLIFKKIKVKFFPNDEWSPGFFTKNPKTSSYILIIFNPSLNTIPLSEAVHLKIPVVGFASASCDIRPLDYPIVLNLDYSGLWFTSFCQALIKKSEISSKPTKDPGISSKSTKKPNDTYPN